MDAGLRMVEVKMEQNVVPQEFVSQMALGIKIYPTVDSAVQMLVKSITSVHGFHIIA